MKRLVTIVTLAIILVLSVLIGLNDTDISIAATSDNEVASSIGKVTITPAFARLTLLLILLE